MNKIDFWWNCELIRCPVDELQPKYERFVQIRDVNETNVDEGANVGRRDREL